jgi:hypothetical protein
MFQYERPTVDNLINNLPQVLKSSRQFLPWNVEGEGKKVPLKQDGTSWGNYNDPTCWRTFDNAVDLVDRGKAFGVGLVLASQHEAATLPEFNLIPGLIALDGDAKRSPAATPYNIPENIRSYIGSLESYAEFSPSLKGLRALVFGTIPTQKQNLTKSFADGTELSLYRAGWVTLTGLPYQTLVPTVEHRQDILDQIVAEHWPDAIAGRSAGIKRAETLLGRPEAFNVAYVLDWGRSAGEDLIQQFIEGWNRTPEQLADITATWDVKRGWNHGDTADNSFYTKRIVEEALWLRQKFGWTLQDVVDIVITFCRKHQLRWSFGRAKKQITDGEQYILAKTRRMEIHISASSVTGSSAHHKQPAPTLTCNGSQIIPEENRISETTLTNPVVNHLCTLVESKSPDTLAPFFRVEEAAKLSGGFKHKSSPRNIVLQAISKHPGWVKAATIAKETSMSAEAVRKQLTRLRAHDFVDSDGKGHFRRHRERKLRRLKPCASKPFPTCKGTNKERKTLSSSALLKRGWPRTLIEQLFPEAGKDYIEREVELEHPIGRVVRARYYWVSRIKAIELQPWFEAERTKVRRQSRSKKVERSASRK